jgi:hypothetical protein
VRELEALLLHAELEPRGKYLELTREVRRALEAGAAAPLPRRNAAAGAPADRAAAAPFTPEELKRLELHRRHRFKASACGQDPEYAGNRQTADLHLRQLLCKALRAAGWDVGGAASLLAGEDPELRGKVLVRLDRFLQNLRSRLEEHGDGEALRRSLAEEWRGSAEAVLEVLDAIRTGHLAIRSGGARDDP